MTVLYLDVQAYFYISCESFYWKQKNFKALSPVIIRPSEVLLLMIMHESEKRKKNQLKFQILGNSSISLLASSWGSQVKQLAFTEHPNLKSFVLLRGWKKQIELMIAISCLEIIFFLTNSNILIFILLKNSCRQKGPDLPSFCHSTTLHCSVLSNTQASEHNYRSSCPKLTNTDITCSSGKGKKKICLLSVTLNLPGEKSPDYNRALTELTE